MAESFSREKLRQAPQKEGGWKNPVLPSSCVTPAGTSIEVQNEWEENTKHTHTRRSHENDSTSAYERKNKNKNRFRVYTHCVHVA